MIFPSVVISDTLLAACLSPVLYPRIAFDRKSFAEKTPFPEFRICSIEKLQFGRTSHTRAAGSSWTLFLLSHRRNYLHGCVTKIILSGDFPGENQIISSTFLWTLSRDPLEDNQFRNLEKTTDCKCTSLAEATAKYEKSNI